VFHQGQEKSQAPRKVQPTTSPITIPLNLAVDPGARKDTERIRHHRVNIRLGQLEVSLVVRNAQVYNLCTGAPPQPPPSGRILPRLRSTSMTGISLVPAPSFSFSSRSFSLAALRARTLSASLPAVTTLCFSLWTLSARRSTLNSSEDCTLRSRDCVCFRRASKDNALSVKDLRIFASSRSRSDGSGSGAVCEEGSPSSG
jgi:hypothetical protein